MASVQTLRLKAKKSAFGKIVISIILLSVLGFLCSHYPTKAGGGWYHQLHQPFFAPPYWLPFVMWVMVYILMGCSAGIIWQFAVKKDAPETAARARKGLVFFGIHLFFNLIFPILLIGLHLPVIGLIDMLVLLVFIGFLIRYFKPVSHTASRLLLPYLIWIGYAVLLNVAIIVLN